MTGNATFRFDRASVVSVCGVDAPRVVTSAEFDDRLADTYHRVGLRPLRPAFNLRPQFS